MTGINQPWLSYVTSVQLPDLSPTTRTPDVVMFMFGMNHNTPLTPAEVLDMRTVVAACVAVSPTPDILFATSTTPSTMSPTRGTKAAQEGRQALAGYTRGYAAQNGYGLIDLARTADCLHNGFDPWTLSWRRLANTGTIALPYTFPQACNDFGVDLIIPGVASTFWAAHGALTFSIGPTAGNVIIIERDGSGNIAFTVNTATGRTSIARTVTGVSAAGTDRPLKVSALSDHLIAQWGSETIYEGPTDRGWAEFTPEITSAAGTPSVTLSQAYVGEAATVMPSLTDLEFWGGDSTAFGGNNENHMAEKARALIMGQTLAATRFA